MALRSLDESLLSLSVSPSFNDNSSTSQRHGHERKEREPERRIVKDAGRQKKSNGEEEESEGGMLEGKTSRLRDSELMNRLFYNYWSRSRTIRAPSLRQGYVTTRYQVLEALSL